MELYNGIMYGVTEEGSGLSVLRTFRLLRILKLVRFLPNLRRQLIVMLKTMDNVAVFFGLLALFIFIFRWELKKRKPRHNFLNFAAFSEWISLDASFVIRRLEFATEKTLTPFCGLLSQFSRCGHLRKSPYFEFALWRFWLKRIGTLSFLLAWREPATGLLYTLWPWWLLVIMSSSISLLLFSWRGFPIR